LQMQGDPLPCRKQDLVLGLIRRNIALAYRDELQTVFPSSFF